MLAKLLLNGMITGSFRVFAEEVLELCFSIFVEEFHDRHECKGCSTGRAKRSDLAGLIGCQGSLDCFLVLAYYVIARIDALVQPGSMIS